MTTHNDQNINFSIKDPDNCSICFKQKNHLDVDFNKHTENIPCIKRNKYIIHQMRHIDAKNQYEFGQKHYIELKHVYDIRC